MSLVVPLAEPMSASGTGTGYEGSVRELSMATGVL